MAIVKLCINCILLYCVTAGLGFPKLQHTFYLQRARLNIQQLHLIRVATGATLPCRCPLLALSATIGNPHQFATWLQRTKTLQQQLDTTAGIAAHPTSYRVTLVLHKERYNDLMHHVFIPDEVAVEEVSGGLGFRGGPMLVQEDESCPASSSSVVGGQPSALSTSNSPAASGGMRHPGGIARSPEGSLAAPDTGAMNDASVTSWSPIWKLGVSREGRGYGNSRNVLSQGNGRSSSSSMGKGGELRSMHPAAAVTLERLRASGWPEGLALAPDEALQLYDAMTAALAAAALQATAMVSTKTGAAAAALRPGAQVAVDVTPEAPSGLLHQALEQLQALNPAELQLLQRGDKTPGSCFIEEVPTAFGKTRKLESAAASIVSSSSAAAAAAAAGGSSKHGAAAAGAHAGGCRPGFACQLLFSRQQAKQWGQQLLQLLVTWSRSDSAALQQLVTTAIQQLRHGLEATEERHLRAWEESVLGQKSPAFGRTYLAVHLMQLLRRLKGEGMMPALVFNFERGGCEMLARVVLEFLEGQEAAARKQYERQLEKIRNAAAEQESAAAAEAAKERPGRGGGDEGSDRGKGMGQEGVTVAATTVCLEGIVFSVNEDMPDPSFTFLEQDKPRSEVRIG